MEATVTATFSHASSLSGFPWQTSAKISAKYALYKMSVSTDSVLEKLWFLPLRYQGPHAGAGMNILVSFKALEHPARGY